MKITNNLLSIFSQNAAKRISNLQSAELDNSAIKTNTKDMRQSVIDQKLVRSYDEKGNARSISLIDTNNAKVVNEVQQICNQLGLMVDTTIPDAKNMYLNAWKKRRI